jgi:glutathione S-transferase
MDLHVSLTSPFSQNVRIALIELGLTERVRTVIVDPWTDPANRAVNPKSQVPALVPDDGTVLIDTPVIVDYLDHHAGGTLFADRWRTLRLQAIANGITESAVRIVVESRRPPAERSEAYVAREQAPLGNGMGDIALGVALAYLDLRFPGGAWREDRQFLDGFADAISQRPSFRATTPPR